MSDKEIDHKYTKEIVCPYCGNEHSDSYEYFYTREVIGVECVGCSKKFTAMQNVIVDYTTEKIEEKK